MEAVHVALTGLCLLHSGDPVTCQFLLLMCHVFTLIDTIHIISSILSLTLSFWLLLPHDARADSSFLLRGVTGPMF